MKTLQEEAEEYTVYPKDSNQFNIATHNFIAGATSEYVHNEIIKGKIEVLEEVLNDQTYDIHNYGIVSRKINALKQ